MPNTSLVAQIKYYKPRYFKVTNHQLKKYIILKISFTNSDKKYLYSFLKMHIALWRKC